MVLRGNPHPPHLILLVPFFSSPLISSHLIHPSPCSLDLFVSQLSRCVRMVRLIDTLITSDTANTDQTVSSTCPPFPFFIPCFLFPHLDLCLSYSSFIFGTEQQSNTVIDMLQITPVPEGGVCHHCVFLPPSYPQASTRSYTQGTTINHCVRQGKWPRFSSSASKPGDSEAMAPMLMKL